MSQKKFTKKNTRKDVVLQLVETEHGYTIEDLAKRIFGEVTWFSRQQIGQILSSLRKDGIIIYPRKKGEEIIIPKTLQDFRDIIKHIFDEGGLPTRYIRALNILIESSMKYSKLIAENKLRVKELETPISQTKKQLKKLK